MPQRKSPDADNRKGVTRALKQAFGAGGHVGADAAADDFAALLAKLDDPPAPFQQQRN